MEFEEYVDARGSALLRLAYLLTGDTHAAEDLAQETLLRALRRWPLVADATDPDAYIRKMCVNVNLSWHRRLASREVSLPNTEQLGARIDDHAETIASRDQLRRALSTLSRRCRSVLVLRYYLDMDDFSIADILKVRPATVRSLARRSLLALRPIIPHPAATAERDLENYRE